MLIQYYSKVGSLFAKFIEKIVSRFIIPHKVWLAHALKYFVLIEIH